MKYLELTPELEKKILDTGILNKGYISESKFEMVKTKITSYDEEKDLFYFLFPPKNGLFNRILFNNKKMVMPYNLDYYDVSPRTVKLDPEYNIKSRKIDYGFWSEKLHPVLKEQYLAIQSQKEIDLIDLLEKLITITKQHIEFKFEEAEWMGLEKIFETFKKDYKKSVYANFRGTCDDSGHMFRGFLDHLKLPDHIIYLQQPASKDSSPHDTTLVVDINNQNWFVVNSLSPNPKKQFNVATKEQLKELGAPFVIENEDDINSPFITFDTIRS